MKTWDAVIVGAGIIGLSLALSLRKRGLRVLVVEKGQPGREASHAAAGMLADWSIEPNGALRDLALQSAHMYPEYVQELQDESGVNVDLRDDGTLLFSGEVNQGEWIAAGDLVPSLADRSRRAVLLRERSVDPRALVAAALKAAKHRGVDISSGADVLGLLRSDGLVTGVRTDKTNYAAAIVVNCAGAWAGQFGEDRFPVRPVKGQMLSVVGAPMDTLRYVVRSPEVYLVPRSDGRILIGATLEEAGYDKRTDAVTIQRMHHAALQLIPALQQARILEDWAGLRPATPDDLPILGATSTPGYYIAAGHYRDGILLAPVTAHVMAQLITGEESGRDLSTFSPARFKIENKQATA
jgi:glycine oxidase